MVRLGRWNCKIVTRQQNALAATIDAFLKAQEKAS
jgi:hypothetical protein